MQMRFTTQQLVDWGANKLLEGVAEPRKREILPVTKYNLLANVFNASTVLLVIAAASAVLFAYTMAFTLGAIGLFVRYTAEKAIDKYMLPPRQENVNDQQQNAHEGIEQIGRELRHALHHASDIEKINNIFENVTLPRQADWEPNQIVFDELALWKEKIDVPPALVAEDQRPIVRMRNIPQNLNPAADAQQPLDRDGQ